MQIRSQQGVVDGLLADASLAIEVYHQAGSLSGELQMKMLVVDLAATAGTRRPRSNWLEKSTDRTGDGLRATGGSGGRALRRSNRAQRFIARHSNPPTIDDLELSQTDDQIHEMASMAVQAWGIPAGRLPFVEKGFRGAVRPRRNGGIGAATSNSRRISPTSSGRKRLTNRTRNEYASARG